MHIVLIKTESGDNFILGPWTEPPTHKQVVEVFTTISADEAEYCEELGYRYTSYELEDAPSGFCLESGAGTTCV